MCDRQAPTLLIHHRRHVDQDFSPFICVSIECNETPAFSEYHDWADHMVDWHGQSWPQFIYPDHIGPGHKSDGIIQTSHRSLEGLQQHVFPKDENFCPLCRLAVKSSIGQDLSEDPTAAMQLDDDYHDLESNSDGRRGSRASPSKKRVLFDSETSPAKKRVLFRATGDTQEQEPHQYSENIDLKLSSSPTYTEMQQAAHTSHAVKRMSRHIATHLQFLGQLTLHLGRSSGELIDGSSPSDKGVSTVESVKTSSREKKHEAISEEDSIQLEELTLNSPAGESKREVSNKSKLVDQDSTKTSTQASSSHTGEGKHLLWRCPFKMAFPDIRSFAKRFRSCTSEWKVRSELT